MKSCIDFALHPNGLVNLGLRILEVVDLVCALTYIYIYSAKCTINNYHVNQCYKQDRLDSSLPPIPFI